MKKLVTLSLMFLSTSIIYGQTSTNEGVAQGDVWFGNIIRELPVRPADTKGSYYLDDMWKMSNITLLSKGIIKGYPAKLDLKHYELDIQVDDEVKVIKLFTVKEFKWLEQSGDSCKYVNTEQLYGVIEGTGRIMEELVNGDVSLYKHFETYIQEANYNVAMNVGSKDDMIKMKEKFYIAVDGKLSKVEPKIKKNASLFGENYGATAKFVKDNKLKLNREEDLVRVVEFLNQI